MLEELTDTRYKMVATDNENKTRIKDIAETIEKQSANTLRQGTRENDEPEEYK